MTPSAIIPQSVLNAPISAWARLVWGQLAFHRNRTTGRCDPKYSTLAGELRTSEDTVGRAVAELRRHGLVTTQKRGHHPNSYELHECGKPVSNSVEKPRPCGHTQPHACGHTQPHACGHTQPHACGVVGSASLYEPELFNLNSLTEVPTTKVEPLRKPARAAAATPSTLDKVQNANAAPTGEIPEQLELMFDQPGLKPEYPVHNIPPVCAPTAASLKPVNRKPQVDSQAPGSSGEPVPVLRAQAEALVEELHAVHPQPGLPLKAIAEVEVILAASEDPAATAELIRRNHQSWKAHWEMLRPGQFVPQLWRWFRDGEWKRAVGKPVRQETWYQRKDRIQREFEAEEHILKPLFDEEMEEWRAKQRRFNCA